MVDVRQCDRKVAEKVLRRLADEPPNAIVRVGPPWRLPMRRGRYGYHEVMGPMVACSKETYAAALWGAALGRHYAAALRRYDRGHSPPLPPWEERLVARDLAEATTPVAWGPAAATVGR